MKTSYKKKVTIPGELISHYDILQADPSQKLDLQVLSLGFTLVSDAQNACCYHQVNKKENIQISL